MLHYDGSFLGMGDVSFTVGFGSDGASVMTGKHNGVVCKAEKGCWACFRYTLRSTSTCTSQLLQRGLITLVAMQVPYKLFTIIRQSQQSTERSMARIQ